MKGKWVDSNLQVIDILVLPRAAGVAETLTFVHIANFATLQPWLHVGYFNSLYTHKSPVLLCAPPLHRSSYVIKLSCSRKVLVACGIELGTFGLQRSESATLATAPQHGWRLLL